MIFCFPKSFWPEIPHATEPPKPEYFSTGSKALRLLAEQNNGLNLSPTILISKTFFENARPPIKPNEEFNSDFLESELQPIIQMLNGFQGKTLSIYHFLDSHFPQFDSVNFTYAPNTLCKAINATINNYFLAVKNQGSQASTSAHSFPDVGIVINPPHFFRGLFSTKHPDTLNPHIFCLDLFLPTDKTKRLSRTLIEHDVITNRFRLKREEFGMNQTDGKIKNNTELRVNPQTLLAFCQNVHGIKNKMGSPAALEIALDTDSLTILRASPDLSPQGYFPFKPHQIALLETEKTKVKNSNFDFFELKSSSILSPFGLSLHYKAIQLLNDQHAAQGSPLPPKIIRYINGYCYQYGSKHHDQNTMASLKKFFQEKEIAALQTDFLGQQIPSFMQKMADIDNRTPSLTSVVIGKELLEKWLESFEHFIKSTAEIFTLLVFNQHEYPHFAGQFQESIQDLREQNPGVDANRVPLNFIEDFGFLFSNGHWIDPLSKPDSSFILQVIRETLSDQTNGSKPSHHHLSLWDYKRPLARGVETLRKILLPLGDLFRNLGFFTQTHDVFFFTLEELQNLFNVPHHLADYKKALLGVLAERKKSFQICQRLYPPSTLPSPPMKQTQSLLRGEIFSKGHTVGSALCVRNLTDFPTPEGAQATKPILVTLALPPQWAGILHRFQGIICEDNFIPHECEKIIRKLSIPTLYKMPQATHLFVSHCGVDLHAEDGWARKVATTL